MPETANIPIINPVRAIMPDIYVNDCSFGYLYAKNRKIRKKHNENNCHGPCLLKACKLVNPKNPKKPNIQYLSIFFLPFSHINPLSILWIIYYTVNWEDINILHSKLMIVIKNV